MLIGIKSNNIKLLKSFLSEEEKEKIKQYFSVFNPKSLIIQKKIPNYPSFIKLYKENKNFLFLPRGCLEDLINLFKDKPYKFIDLCIITNEFNIKLNCELFKYQQEAVENLIKQDMGILVAPAGSGKSIMGLKIIEILKQNSLILVHTTELLNQWKKNIKKFVDFEPGQIGDRVKKIKEITVGLYQSFFNFTDNEFKKINRYFGCVIGDEIHRVPPKHFFRVFDNLAAKYKYGLTATLQRKDGLDFLIFSLLGSNVIEVSEEEVIKANRIIKGKVYFIDCPFVYHNNYKDWNNLIKKIIENENRNKLIIEIIKKLIANQRNVLVITERVEHCEKLFNLLGDLQSISRMIYGKVSLKERSEIKEDFINEKIKVLIATRHLMGEGVDLVNLNSLILTVPYNNFGLLKQIIGRIQRAYENKKEPIVFDLVDFRIRYLAYLKNRRKYFYQKMNFEIYEKEF